jgi:type II secretory pathway predicted ATPase ExeA
MYRPYYRLQKNVNHKDIAVEELFNSTGYKEARARLDYMKDKRGLVLVSGLSGVGKTTLLRSFAESLDPKSFKIDYVPLSTVSVNDFYRQLAYLLSGQTLYKKDIPFRTIQQAITELAVNKKIIPIIIFDDAHFLKNENFFELQILSNFNFDSLSPALFVLIAQPHLQDRLKRPVFDSFYQRIAMQINLQPLSCQETKDFIVQVLKNAAGVGGSGAGDGLSLQTSNASTSTSVSTVSTSTSRFENLFTPQACQMIFKCSGGIPRLIAKIMEKALIYGSAHQLDTLDENVIYQIEPEL